MAVPKYRPSSHRQGRRRATHKVKLPDVTKCQFCGAEKQPHFACPNCGKIGTKKLKAESKKPNAQNKKDDSQKEK